MRKTIIISFLAVISLALTYRVSDAVVQGACVNCHTMHNSQNGAVVVAGGPYLTLLKGDCIGCHGQAPAGTNEIINNTPQVLHASGTDLAGGNFAYITGNKTRDATDPGANQNSVGHNVTDLGATYKEANITGTFPPGDQFTTGITKDNFTCAGVYGCHGDRTLSGSMNAIKGSHHVNDKYLKFGANLDETQQGATTAMSYRFLKGVKGAEASDWKNTDATHHNEYKGGTFGGTSEDATSKTSPGTTGSISGLCAECHGNFHGQSSDIGTGPWLRHPTDIILPSTVTKEYQYYNACAGGGAACTYSVNAPVARANTISNANYPSAKGTLTPGATNDAVVMCLSCHKVHGGANADILRWNYSTINAGGGSDNTRCFICHTTKDTGA